MMAKVEVSPMSFGCLISSTLPVASDRPCPKQTTRRGLRCPRAGVAQLAEHLTCNEDAVGSSPTSGLCGLLAVRDDELKSGDLQAFLAESVIVDCGFERGDEGVARLRADRFASRGRA